MKQKLTDAVSGKQQSQTEAQKKAPPKTPPTQTKPANEKPAGKTTPAKPANQSAASPANEKKVDISVCHCLLCDLKIETSINEQPVSRGILPELGPSHSFVHISWSRCC